MKISMLCFSLTGWETGKRIKEGLLKNVDKAALPEGCGEKVTERNILLKGKSRYLQDCIAEGHTEWTGKQFEDKVDAIIFVCACGIAVRSIAPFIKSKKTDPAVLVVDECGKFVISLLSGHLGGANELAAEVADILGAVPVITTATDLHHRFAVDMFARKNQCDIHPLKAGIPVSAAILAGEPVGFYSDFDWEGELPEGLVLCDQYGKIRQPKENGQEEASCSVGIAVSVRKDCVPFSTTVHIIPRIVSLGLGCRKGKDGDTIRNKVLQCLAGEDGQGIYLQALERIASIDLKKEEEGILQLAAAWNLPFETFSAEELGAAEGSVIGSSFVSSITGVDNVCERSAILASKNGSLIRKKAGEDGVTTALAQREWRVRFE